MVSQALSQSAIASWQGNNQYPSTRDRDALSRGKILVTAQPHGFTGGHVSATLSLRIFPDALWPHLTDYPRWVDYFPEMTHSEAIAPTDQGQPRIYQVGRKSILGLGAEVEVYLRVQTHPPHRLQFVMERGTLADFTASFALAPWRLGTLLTFTVQATPLIPLPGFFVEQSMRRELPTSLAQMRRVIEAIAHPA
ncbi:SRPBCC family protein [Leptolyngbya sp. PCC 6406]|uniref:SRPBCC family protein n=1 Tax=Leptolyngbya sp. PCC 6406 TaxID=1173264 RepID=UPI0002AC84C8|nr:SRPBCC family protein [Leptolyngbya sp. PCC 6406]